jgi:multiple sugar transport system substrate-binding protein
MKIPERSDTQVHGSRSTLTRRQMLRLLATGAVTAAGGALLAACGGTAPTTPPGSAPAQTSTRPLTPTFYQWIVDLHPSIPQVNSTFEGLNFQIAPVQGFGIERFVAEAKNQESTWDVYVGMTPFVEMSQLIKADVIEPWDDYIPKDVLDDILPPIREECTVNGKLYSWPFLLDVIGMTWNSNLTDKAGITTVPTTWDEYLANAKQVVDSGAAPYGATHDARGWRSLAPFTHSLSTNVYTPDSGRIRASLRCM